MKTAIMLCLLFSSLLIFITHEQKIYGVNHLKSFTGQIPGCTDSVAIGTYIYPDGSLDMLKISFQNNANIQGRCSHPEKYVKIFGGNQDYSKLIGFSAKSVAANIKSAVTRLPGLKGIIINWEYLVEGQIQKISQWLSQFIAECTFTDVYLKAPASFFCYTEKNRKFILGVNGAKKFIIKVYGQQPLSYENVYDIFERTVSKQGPNEKYPQSICPKYPSIEQLKQFEGDFFIETTLQQEQPGFLGPVFEQALLQHATTYKNRVFYDAHPDSLINL